MDYLIESVQEIGKHPFQIRIHCPAPTSEAMLPGVQQSIRNYFTYSQELERRSFRKTIKSASTHFGIGLIILTVVTAMAWGGAEENMGLLLLEQGLTIAAWVLVWEALATFVVQWPESASEMNIYRRLANAPVEFRPFVVPSEVDPPKAPAA